MSDETLVVDSQTYEQAQANSIADAVLALINGQPSTPTRERLAAAVFEHLEPPLRRDLTSFSLVMRDES